MTNLELIHRQSSLLLLLLLHLRWLTYCCCCCHRLPQAPSCFLCNLTGFAIGAAAATSAAAVAAAVVAAVAAAVAAIMPPHRQKLEEAVACGHDHKLLIYWVE
jgi:hypothetical protein